jgi:hypothetical protein
MSSFRVSHSVLKDGVWSAVLSGGSGVPRLEVLHLDAPVADVAIAETPEGWKVDVPIPAEAISDGVQTFVVRDVTANDKLTDFTLIAGEALDDDIRAEVDLLRAELDMLKRAFRRHCVETS